VNHADVWIGWLSGQDHLSAAPRGERLGELLERVACSLPRFSAAIAWEAITDDKWSYIAATLSGVGVTEA
jgi:hypothetical protein